MFSLLWFIALSQLFYAHVLLLGCQKKVTVGECKIFTFSVNHFSFIRITINHQLRDFYVIIFTAKD